MYLVKVASEPHIFFIVILIIGKTLYTEEGQKVPRYTDNFEFE